MKSFQIIGRDGKPVTLGDLNKEAAEIWGVRNDKGYAYPFDLEEIPENASFKEKFQLESLNESIREFNWFNVVGWYIAYQEGNSYAKDSWANVVHTMVAKQLGEKLIDFEHPFIFRFNSNETGIDDEVQKKLVEFMLTYKPMIDLINYWATKGYTPKQILNEND